VWFDRLFRLAVASVLALLLVFWVVFALIRWAT
jgi:hypothetical protein